MHETWNDDGVAAHEWPAPETSSLDALRGEWMNAAMLALDPSTRVDLWRELVAVIERSIDGADELPVFTEQDAAEVRAFVERVDFDAPLEPVEALRLATEGLSRYTVNFRSPRYFGLFDPAPTAMGIVAEALTAAFNPQLAAWLATPFAIEAESRLIREFGVRFGLAAGSMDGTFTSGGAEANHTALLTALLGVGLHPVP